MSATGDDALGVFRRGPAVFTVRRTGADYRVDCDDGAGPCEVCRLSDRPGSGTQWHGAWNGDAWCAWIEAEARKRISQSP